MPKPPLRSGFVTPVGCVIIEMNSYSDKGMYWLIRLCVVLVFALLGHSLTRVEGIPQEDGLAFALVGAFFAGIALFISSLFRPKTSQLENSHPPSHFLGLRVGVVGFFVAFCGWLVAIYINGKAGLVLIAVGILVGFVGMLMHFYFMCCGSNHA